MDALPAETVGPSVTMYEEADLKEPAADVTEEMLKEPPSPGVVQPPHTSPDLGFASEVNELITDLKSYKQKYTIL